MPLVGGRSGDASGIQLALCRLALLLSAAAHAAEAPAVPATAQPANSGTPPGSAAPAAGAGGAASPPAQLAEVVVTATKRKQKLRDIPASITELPGKELEHRGAQGTADIVKLVPGVNFTTTGDDPPRITIRGISSDIGTSATTGAIFGDVSFTDAYVPFVTLDPNPFDLKSVEVLKGPQGTLFGASNLNGAIRYIPEPPRFGVWQSRYFLNDTAITEGGFRPSYGGVVNIPVGGRDDLALRLMGFERNTPGYVDNKLSGVPRSNHLNQGGARGILGWQPTEALDVDLTYAWQNTHLADTSVTDNRNGQLSTSNRPRLSPNQQDYELGNATVRYDLGWGQLISDSAYIRKSAYNFFDASSRYVSPPPFTLVAQAYQSASKTYSQELRLVSPEDQTASWHWVTGALWWQQHIHNLFTVPLGSNAILPTQVTPVLLNLGPQLGNVFTSGGVPLVQSVNPIVQVTEYALFGEVTRRLFQHVDLTLGGRAYRTQSGGSNTISGLGALLEAQSTEQVIAGKIDQQGFNPKASIAVHATNNVMAYAATSRGYRVGGVQFGASIVPQPQSPVPNFFKSDTIWNYESGIRTQWLHNTLRFDLTGFLERWKTPQIIEASSTSTSVFINNVGGARSVGGETQLQYLFPLKGLMLTAGAAYAHTVTTVEFTTSNGSQVPPGTQWPLSPKWQTATTLAYITDVGSWNLNGYITHTFLGRSISDLTERNPIFNYQQLDVQLSVLNKDVRWLPEISLLANNVLDKRGIVNEFQSPVPVPPEVTYIQPRTITVRASGRF